MGRVVLSFSTTHNAMAAEDVLREAGIALQVIPLPQWIGAECGLAVRLNQSVVAAALEELARARVPVKGAHEEPAARDV